MYADDGLLFANSKSEIDLMSLSIGSIVSLNLDKSGYVKSDGEYLKPLKFCGISYDSRLETVKSETRNKANLEFSNKEKLLSLCSELRDDVSSYSNKPRNSEIKTVSELITFGLDLLSDMKKPCKLLFSNKFSGYFLSGLYCNSFNKHTKVCKDFFTPFTFGASKHAPNLLILNKIKPCPEMECQLQSCKKSKAI